MNVYNELEHLIDWHSRDPQTLDVGDGSYPSVRFRIFDMSTVAYGGGRVKTVTTIVNPRSYGELGDRVVEVYKGKEHLLTAEVENCGWGTKKVFLLMRILGFKA